MSQYITGQTVADEIGGWARLNDALDDDGDGQVEAGLLDRFIQAARAMQWMAFSRGDM